MPLDDYLALRILERDPDTGAPRRAVIRLAADDAVRPFATIQFQAGPIRSPSTDPSAPGAAVINGASDELLLELLIQRTEAWQGSPYACEENEMALDHLRMALLAKQTRTARREEQGVEGLQVPDPPRPDSLGEAMNREARQQLAADEGSGQNVTFGGLHQRPTRTASAPPSTGTTAAKEGAKRKAAGKKKNPFARKSKADAISTDEKNPSAAEASAAAARALNEATNSLRIEADPTRTPGTHVRAVVEGPAESFQMLHTLVEYPNLEQRS